MGFLERFWKKEEAPVELPPAGEGVLALLFNGNAPLESQLDEDVALYREAGADVVSSKAPSVAELRELIITRRPEVVHLLASFTDQGSLVDASKNELYLRDLMTVSEEAGVRLFIIASENDFNHIRAQIAKSRVMSFLTTIKRNRHFATFLEGILAGLSENPNFALAYVKLAPQSQQVQLGLPLPATIAICPGKKGKDLVLWTEAQE